MRDRTDSDSRKLLKRLKEILAAAGGEQDRLDQITHHIADSMGTEVCSIYLFRDADTLELCATEGLRPEAVHQTRLRLGEGLVGRVARTGRHVNTADAPSEPGFRFMPETGEEVFPAFLGVPIQRVGERQRPGRAMRDRPAVLRGRGLWPGGRGHGPGRDDRTGRVPGQPVRQPAAGAPLSASGARRHRAGGRGRGRSLYAQARVVIANPVGDDPETELARLRERGDAARPVGGCCRAVDMAATAVMHAVLETYRMFAHSRSWLKRMEEDIRLGLSAEAAVEKEQSGARARLEMAADPICATGCTIWTTCRTACCAS